MFTRPARADQLDDVKRQLGDLTKQLEMSQQATRPLEATLSNLKKQIDSIRYQISVIKKQLKQEELSLENLEKDIQTRERGADKIKKQLDRQVVYHYRLSRAFSPLALLLNLGLNNQTILTINLEKGLVILSQQRIKNISTQLITIKKDKQKLQQNRRRLLAKQKQVSQIEDQLNKQITFYQQEITKAKSFQETLQQKIAELSRRQKELLAQKTGMFTTTVGDILLTGDPNSRPDYDPGFRPAFAVFSFGAPHHKGMSQYGAYGRAKTGQSAEQILKAYYGDIRIVNVDTNFSISTDQGRKRFEDNYMKGIAEMPVKWADDGGFEALKAQAIAARSYALAYTGWRMSSRSLKASICTSEHCQVYRSSKASNPGRWGDAVNQTKGQILVSNQTNEIVNAWYSSTSGGYMQSYTSLGYTTPSFWDTKCGNQRCWTPDAYEKIAGSPWFYKGWYKSRSGRNCGRNHPWLNQKEMADIINAAIVLKNESNNKNHIYQLDGCLGSNPDAWSMDRMAQEADKYGGRITSINGVSVKYSNNGYTSQVIFTTNRGRVKLAGDLFKLTFNLRAPGAIHIASSLYNIARK